MSLYKLKKRTASNELYTFRSLVPVLTQGDYVMCYSVYPTLLRGLQVFQLHRLRAVGGAAARGQRATHDGARETIWCRSLPNAAWTQHRHSPGGLAGRPGHLACLTRSGPGVKLVKHSLIKSSPELNSSKSKKFSYLSLEVIFLFLCLLLSFFLPFCFLFFCVFFLGGGSFFFWVSLSFALLLLCFVFVFFDLVTCLLA